MTEKLDYLVKGGLGIDFHLVLTHQHIVLGYSANVTLSLTAAS